jgi:hypothetical protein
MTLTDTLVAAVTTVSAVVLWGLAVWSMTW